MSILNPTSQSMREAIYAALTSPALTYMHDNGTAYVQETLPTNSVVARSVWLTGGDAAPNPLVCYSVEGRGNVSRTIPGERRMRINVWVATHDELSCTEIAEAVRARLNFADQDAETTTDLSRSGGTYQRPLAVREFIETDQHPCMFDDKTARWYIHFEFSAYAA